MLIAGRERVMPGRSQSALLLNGRTITMATMAQDGPLSPLEAKWLQTVIPAYHAGMHVVRAGTNTDMPLAVVAWEPLPAPDADWLEIHVANRPRRGLASGFRAMLDALAWIPHVKDHAGLIVDVLADRFDLLTLLCRVGFEPIASVGEFCRPRILFQRSAGTVPIVQECSIAISPALWKVAAAHPPRHHGVAPVELLTNSSAAFWCRQGTALRELGLPASTSPENLQRAGRCSVNNTFRSHASAAATLWSLCTSPTECGMIHVLLMDWKGCVRSPDSLRRLSETIRHSVAPGEELRCPACAGIPHYMFAAFGLQVRGLSAGGRSVRLQREITATPK